MIDLRPHKKWMGVWAVSLLLGAASTPLLGVALHKAEQRRTALLQQKEKALNDIQQLNEDTAAAEKMKNEIDAVEARKYLAPADRLQAANILESRAAEARLTNLAYTFSPEEKVIVDTVGAGKQQLAKSKWCVTADAPSDIDVYNFLDALQQTLPGRLTLSQISIERIGEKEAISNANVRLTVSGEWLSNGASQTFAEQDQ